MISRFDTYGHASLLDINSIWQACYIGIPDIVDILGCERQAEQALVLLLCIAREILIHRTATRKA